MYVVSVYSSDINQAACHIAEETYVLIVNIFPARLVYVVGLSVSSSDIISRVCFLGGFPLSLFFFKFSQKTARQIFTLVFTLLWKHIFSCRGLAAALHSENKVTGSILSWGKLKKITSLALAASGPIRP